MVESPVRSQDLAPLDKFFWRYLKSKAYLTREFRSFKYIKKFETLQKILQETLNTIYTSSRVLSDC